MNTVAEILDDPAIAERKSTTDLVVNKLRLVATSSLDVNDEKNWGPVKLLRRIIRLYSKASFRKFVDVPTEMLLLVQHKAGNSTATMTCNPFLLEFIQFLTEEAIPGDILKALLLLNECPIHQPELLPMLRKVLKRGAELGSEVSSSLLRIRQARKRLDHSDHTTSLVTDVILAPGRSIWTCMATGTLLIDK
jgi:hypothetical protein